MSNSQRAGLIAAAVLVAIVAFLVLRPGDEESDSPPPTGRDAPPLTTPSETTPPPTDETGPATPRPSPAEPEIPPIEVRDGKPVGGVEELQFERGDTIEFSVKSDAEHEVHLHGYDVSKDVRAGGTVRFRLKAKIEGVFEVELEDTHTQIAELRVRP